MEWFNDFLGIAYRYFDLRMNIVLLFSDKNITSSIWNETVSWWIDNLIKIRFLEIKNKYWFIMSGCSRYEKANKSFYKILLKSKHYERFKYGCNCEAYLRFGTYCIKYKNDVKYDDICDCGHTMNVHNINDKKINSCTKNCNCKKFITFQITLLKKKKVINNIKFLKNNEIKKDSVVWNCFYINSKT